MAALKNSCCLRRNDEFRNFSRQHVVFPSEVNAALTFLFTLCGKTKSKIRLIRQKTIGIQVHANHSSLTGSPQLFKLIHFLPRGLTFYKILSNSDLL